MRIFAVGRENLDRFDNTNSRKFVDQRSLMGSREGGGGRLTSLSRDDESKRRWKGNWIILTNILVTKSKWPNNFFTIHHKWRTNKCCPLVTTTLKFKVADEKRPFSEGTLFPRKKSGKGIFLEKVPSIPFSLAPRADYIRYKELPSPQLSNFPNLPRAWKRGGGKFEREYENEFNEHREKYRIYIHIFNAIIRSKR